MSKILALTGLTEADIKSVRYHFDCMWREIRTHNHRVFFVTDEELSRA